MAYHNEYGKTHSLTGFSWIDGVQVKIGEKFLPPKKVTLPLDFQMGNPSEVLFLEYDFSLEERVIQWAEAQRKEQETQKEALEEEAKRKAELEAAAAPSKEPAEQPLPNGHIPQPETHHNNTAEPVSQGTPGQQLNPLLNFGTTILTPTPLATSSTPTQNASKNTSNSSFDLKDFEGENDPFESMELKVLNDREQLNQMLRGVQGTATQPNPEAQGTASGSPSDANPDNSSNANSGSTVKAQGLTNTQQQANQPDVQLTGQPPPPPRPVPAIRSLKDVDYPSLESLSLDSILGPSSNVQQNTPVTSGLPVNVGPPTSTTPVQRGTSGYSQGGQNVQVNAGSGHAFYSNRTQTQTTSTTPSVAERNPTAFTKLPPVPSARNLTQQATPSTFSAQSVSNNAYTPSPEKGKLGGFDFYSRHAANFMPNGIASHAVYGHHESRQATPSTNTLRSARSTPDISKLDEKMESPAMPSSHTPPPYPRPRTHSPPPRPSSQQNQECNKIGTFSKDSDSESDINTLHFVSDHFQAWNPYSVLPATPSSKPVKPTPAPRTRRNSAGPFRQELPDPYPSLTGEEQRFVDNIADMGFPRSRVSRAVEKFGLDDKQVIDHLCSLTRLCEKGYTESNATAALHLFANSEDKTLQYLQLFSQFKELGFEADKISEALVASDLNEDKSLDLLTAT